MKNSIYYKVLSIVFLVLLTVGCSTKELTKFSDDNSCLTTLEGNYFKDLTASTSYPAVFLKMPLNPKLLKGELISIDSNGIVFNPASVGFYDEEETFYPYDTLYGVINQKGKLVYGSIPEYYAVKHKLIMEISQVDTKSKSKLVLEPNEPFAYCINPGKYTITSIMFVTNKRLEDVGVDYPKVSLDIKEGNVNYFGNIYVDYKSAEDENVIVIPCMRNDPDGAAVAGMFGLIGSVAHAISTGIESEGLHHVINIERDKNFLPESNLPITEVFIDVSSELIE